MKIKQLIVPLIFIAFVMFSCKKEKLYADISKLKGTGVIEIGPHNVSGNIGKVFSKYIYVTAPNGRRIDIFGTSGVSDEQMEYAKSIFGHYFNSDGDVYKSTTKKIIANSLANKRSALVFFATQEEYEANIQKVGAVGYNVQDLYASESLNSGNRDASYEEILHLVHNYGIAPTLHEYQYRLQKANDNAIANGLYSPASDLPKADYEDEYFAAIMDCYLGLWVGTSGTMYGEYKPTSKQEMLTQDPDGYQLIRDLFGDIEPVQ